MPGVVICFVSLCIRLVSRHVIVFVVESLLANSHPFNSEWGGGFVAGEQGHQGFFGRCLPQTYLGDRTSISVWRALPH